MSLAAVAQLADVLGYLCSSRLAGRHATHASGAATLRRGSIDWALVLSSS
jgi:hypothetical protein